MLNMRTLIGIPAAAVVTYLLFVLMRSMIAYDGPVIEDETPTVVIVIGRQVTDSDTQQKDIKTTIEEPEEDIPPIVRSTTPDDVEDDPIVVDDGWDDKSKIDVSGPEVCGQPIVRVAPSYPRRAADQGIEGWALIGFTVTTEGLTRDVHVIDDEPKGVFGKEAVKAVKRWRYQPCVVNGKISEVKLQVMLSFELEK